jgi:pimeloyl-ACP methyl ester carboxylesterase
VSLEAGERPTALSADLLREFLPFPLPDGPLPDATPPGGPDPYGNTDPEWLRMDWRPLLHRADIDGAEVNYVEMGSGDPAILFVHGLSGSWQNWLENMPHLARSHRVVALDLPGFGGSPMPPWELTIEAYGRMLHDFCEELAISGAVLVGNSMGGFVAAEAATTGTDRFDKLVLVSAAGISHATMRKRPAESMARMAAATAPIGLAAQERSLLRPRLRHLAFRQVVRWPLRLRRELLWELFHNGAAKPGLVPAVSGLIGYDFLDSLEDVDLPTLIVWGREDRIVPSTDSIGYGRRLRNSRTEIYADTGHVPQLERPVRFNRDLERFIAG